MSRAAESTHVGFLVSPMTPHEAMPDTSPTVMSRMRKPSNCT